LEVFLCKVFQGHRKLVFLQTRANPSRLRLMI